jgi:energy-coupling factor transport system ATP-binding protein
MPFIELDSVSFSYPGEASPALADISLSIAPGEYLALVGRNGSGKSTLIRLLDGLRKASSGKVLVAPAGAAYLDAADPANDHAIRSSVALVFQSPQDQIVSTLVEEDVAFGPENLGLPRAEIETRVAEALAATGLSDERKRPSLFLSAGQQQRLAIAGALAMKPSCIAFDEATSMLDPPSRAEILDLIDTLVDRGITVVHATHDMAEAARASRVIALESGRMAFDGRPEELFMPGQAGATKDSTRAGELGLGLPPAASLALELGLEPVAREDARELAARAFAAAPRVAGRLLSLRAAATARSSSAAAPSGAEPSFAAEHADFAYLRGTANERKALHDVSLVVEKGVMLALVGRTGSGKSSLLQLLDALAMPSAGRVLAFGEDTKDKATDLRKLRMRAPLAVQRSEAALFEPYAADDVAFGPRNEGLSGAALVERVRGAMEAAGLPYAEYRDRGTRALSGGEKRKLALSGVLALAPDALLLDEPTSALDPESRAAVMGLIEGFSRSGKTVVFATHSMEEAARADLVAVIVEGRLSALAPPADIFGKRYDALWRIGKPFRREFEDELERLSAGEASRG